MRRRKGVTVFSVLSIAFVILAAAAYGVILYVLAPMFAKEAEQAKVIGEAFDLVTANKGILAAFTEFGDDLVPNITVFATVGLCAIVTIIWLIVGLRRGRKICIFFALINIVANYVGLLYYFAVSPLQDFITKYVEQYPLLFILLGCALVASLAAIFSLILFIVDMATGKVEKQPTPTFIKEPTEEVEEPVYEEVKDENEVKKEEAPAPAPVEEEKKEEKAPVEEEKEEQPKEVVPDEDKEEEVVDKAPKAKPVKKQTKKPEAKKAPIKKAEPKKEEKKPAPKKEPAKKAEPADARKTGTIVLQNEEGKTYAKAFHVSRRPELNKWQVKATGSDKALKLFNTQKEAIEYANQLAKNQNVSVRVHSKEGKLRKHNG